MLKIKDRILHGMITGIIAGTPDAIINALEYRAGLTDLKYGQMGANVFLPESKINDKKAKVLGILTNYTLIGASGTLFSYLLSATGRDKAVIKGIGYGILSWLAIYGMGAKVGLTVQTKKPLAPLLSFIDHVLYGGLLGLIAPKIGDDSLFPDNKQQTGTQPLIATGEEIARKNDKNG